MFESWVAAEVLKARLHAGLRADLYHLREDRGVELDLVAETGDRVYGVEVKSGATLAPDFFRHLLTFPDQTKARVPHLRPIPRLVYGGDRHEIRAGVEVVPWADLPAVAW